MPESIIDFTSAATRLKIPRERLQAIFELNIKLYGGFPSQESDISGMLVWAIGNEKFNQALGGCAQDEELCNYINKETVNLLRTLSYKTRFLHKIANNFDQIYENFTAAQTQGKALTPAEKISLKQYGILYDLARLNTVFLRLKDTGLIESNDALSSLHAMQQKAYELISFFDDTFGKKVASNSGKIISFSVGRKATLCDSKRNFMDKLVHFLEKFSHTAYEIKSDKGEKLSHINPKYKQEQLNLKTALYSEVYELQLENLISDEAREILQKHYGEDWIQVVNHKYRLIERNIHDNRMMGYEQFEADTPPLTLFKIFTSWLQGGNKTWFEQHHSNEDIRDKIFSQGKWEKHNDSGPIKLMCSEFIGMTLIAAIQELNEQLKQDIARSNPQTLPTLFKSPLSKREKLHILTPCRLLIALEKRGAVRKIDHIGQELGQYVSTSKKASKNRRTSPETEIDPADTEELKKRPR